MTQRRICACLSDFTEPGGIHCPSCAASRARRPQPLSGMREAPELTADVLAAAGIDPAEAAEYIGSG